MSADTGHPAVRRQPVTRHAGSGQLHCAVRRLEGWVLYFQMTFSSAASGSVVCLGSGSTGATQLHGDRHHKSFRKFN